MQTIQIEDVTTGPDKRRLFTAMEAAAALAACGFPIRHKQQEIPSQSRKESLWFCDARVDEAHSLLLRAAILSGPESLLVRSPEDACLAGLWAIRSMDLMVRWIGGGAVPAAIKPAEKGRLLCLQAAAATDLMALVWQAARPETHVDITEGPHLAFCAAAAVCGFLPYPRLTGTACPQMHFAGESFTFEGLRLDHFQQPAVPGAKADSGRHVFSYALSACLTLQQYARLASIARRRTFLLRGRFNSEKTAVIDSEILRESNGDLRAAREQVEEHLASV